MKKLIMYILLLLFSGCSSVALDNSLANNMINNNRQAVYNTLVHAKLKLNSTIIVTTFTKVDNINTTSKVGKILTQNTISSLVNDGMNVVELHLRKDNVIKMNRNGVFILSNDAKQVIKNRNADAILVGNYSVLFNKDLYVNIKLINPRNGLIIGSADYLVNLDNK